MKNYARFCFLEETFPALRCLHELKASIVSAVETIIVAASSRVRLDDQDLVELEDLSSAGLQSPSVRRPTTNAVAESGPFWCTSPAHLQRRAAAAAVAAAEQERDLLDKELKRQENRRERMLKLTEEMGSAVRQKKQRLQRQQRWQRKKTGGAFSVGKAISGTDDDDVTSIETSTLSPESREDDRGSEHFGSNASCLVGVAEHGNGDGNEEPKEKPISSNKSSKWDAMGAKVAAMPRPGQLKLATSRSLETASLGPSQQLTLMSAPAAESSVYPDGFSISKRRTVEVEIIRTFDSLTINTSAGDFWLLVDAVWMREWVDFVMGDGDPPGPISNLRLFLDVTELPRAQQESLVREHAAEPTQRLDEERVSRPDLKVREGLKAGKDFRALHPIVWFIYRTIYSTDGAPYVCRWKPDLYSADVSTHRKMKVMWSYQNKARYELGRFVERARLQESLPVPPRPRMVSLPVRTSPMTSREVTVAQTSTASGRFKAVTGVGILMGRFKKVAREKMGKKAHSSRRLKVSPKRETSSYNYNSNNSSSSSSSKNMTGSTSRPSH